MPSRRFRVVSTCAALLLLLGLARGPLPAQTATQTDPLEQTITSEDLRRHVTFLASDEMKGRASGSEEAQKAADYVVEAFKAAGLKPGGPGGSWFQEVSFPGGTCRNVLGVLPGSSSTLRREFVIVGAHYDHVGLGDFGSRTPGRRGEVHNGADDNASGTSTLLELVEAFAQSPPKRSLLFIAFTAEERGLFGSRAWAKSPTVPLKSVVTMYNLDMIGRSSNGYVFVGGANSGSGFQELVREVTEPFKLDVELSGGGRGPSDHQTFYDEHIPVLFLFTGEHTDYHTPDDDIEKLPFDALQTLGRVSSRLLRHSGDGKRPRWQQDDRGAMPVTSERAWDHARTLLGVRLEASGTEDGVPFDVVSKKGAAAQAGLADGDTIGAIAGEDMKTPLQVQRRLAYARPGEQLEFRIVRGGRSKLLKLRIPR